MDKIKTIGIKSEEDDCFLSNDQILKLASMKYTFMLDKGFNESVIFPQECMPCSMAITINNQQNNHDRHSCEHVISEYTKCVCHTHFACQLKWTWCAPNIIP